MTIYLQRDSTIENGCKYLKLDSKVNPCNLKTASELLKGKKRSLDVDQPTVRKLQNINVRQLERIERDQETKEELNNRKDSSLKTNAQSYKVMKVVSALNSAQTASEEKLLAQNVSEIRYRKEVTKANQPLCKELPDSFGSYENSLTTSTRTNVQKLRNETTRHLQKEFSGSLSRKIETDRVLKKIMQRIDEKGKATFVSVERQPEHCKANSLIEDDENDEEMDIYDNEYNEEDAPVIRSNVLSTNTHYAATAKRSGSQLCAIPKFSERERDSEYAQILCEMSEGTKLVPDDQKSSSSRRKRGIAENSTMEGAVELSENDFIKAADSNDRETTNSLQFLYQCPTKNRTGAEKFVEDSNENTNVSTSVEINQIKEHKHVVSKRAKIHARNAEVCFAQVGKSAKIWLQEHPQIKGIYLNKGKREVKRNLVSLKRQSTAVDKGSYMRNGRINDKNRIDDSFVFTPEGQRRRDSFEDGKYRDEYVVNWYMWCPGHGNCKRKCGGFGRCVEGLYTVQM